MTPAPDHLGQFELYVLLALARIGDDAYGVTIREEIELHVQHAVSHGAIYVTLDRLAERGYVTFWMSDARPVPGGRRRKHVRLTAAGRRAMTEAARGVASLLDGVDLGYAGRAKR